MAIASPSAVMIIAVVLISGLSALPAKPAAPALLTAQPAPIAAAAKAMAAERNLNINGSEVVGCASAAAAKGVDVRHSVMSEAYNTQRGSWGLKTPSASLNRYLTFLPISLIKRRICCSFASPPQFRQREY
jgi:hypothetical protein